MQKISFKASLLAIVGMTAFAANAQAQEVSGAFEVGTAITNYKQSDNDAKGTAAGVYVNTFANVALTDAFTLNVNVAGEYLDVNRDEFYYTTPNQSGAVGAALNYKAGSLTLGAFGSLGATNNFDNRLGYVVGGQAAFDLGTFKPFAQVGFADIRVDGADSGFTGLVTRGGVEYAYSEKLAFTVDGGYGHAKNGYEDTPDSGTYWNLGGKAVFHLTGALYGTASYDYREFEANTEDDAREHAFRLGIAIPFGGTKSASSFFNNLAAPLLPYRAASYGEVLD